MKKLVFAILVVMGFAGMAMLNSCNKGETYSEMKKKEKNAIEAFIKDNSLIGPIHVISESTFYAQDSLTDTKNNEFVLFQEDGIYMTRDYYENHRDHARRFAEASRKGWEWAAEHPEEALDIVMQYVDREHIATNRVMQRLMLKEVLRLQVDRESKKREFRLRRDMVQQASRLMVDNHMLSREVTYEELLDKKK